MGSVEQPLLGWRLAGPQTSLAIPANLIVLRAERARLQTSAVPEPADDIPGAWQVNAQGGGPARTPFVQQPL